MERSSRSCRYPVLMQIIECRKFRVFALDYSFLYKKAFYNLFYTKFVFAFFFILVTLFLTKIYILVIFLIMINICTIFSAMQPVDLIFTEKMGNALVLYYIFYLYVLSLFLLFLMQYIVLNIKERIFVLNLTVFTSHVLYS